MYVMLCNINYSFNVYAGENVTSTAKQNQRKIIGKS